MKLMQSTNRAYCFELVLDTHLDKSYRENEIGAWNRSCLWPLLAHKETVSYKPRISWTFSIYIYTSVQNYFQNSLMQTFKFTWKGVDNWCNFPISYISRWLYVSLYFISQMWTMKLTASTNFCYISDRVVCKVKLNIKETFMGNNGFLTTFMWWMHYRQRIKDVLLDKFSI